MGFIYNGGQNDITFAAETPRGMPFLRSLRTRGQAATMYRPDGTLHEGWNNLEQLVNIRHNRVVPRWAIYGPPTSRPLNPTGAQNLQNMTTLGLWQQLRKSGNNAVSISSQNKGGM